MKRSFVMYHDQKAVFDNLSDEDAGKLIKSIYEYAEGNEPVLNGLMCALFASFKATLDRDAGKWSVTKEKRREAGRLGGLAKASNAKHCQANLAVSVSGSVSGSVKEPIVADAPACDLEKKENNNSKPSLPPKTPVPPPDFEKAWEMYRKKGNKQIALRYWKKLNEEDRNAITAKIPAYVASREQECYQKDFQGWINPTNRMWEDEIVQKASEKHGNAPYFPY